MRSHELTPSGRVLGIGTDMEAETRARIDEDVDSCGSYLQKFKLYETHLVYITTLFDSYS